MDPFPSLEQPPAARSHVRPRAGAPLRNALLTLLCALGLGLGVFWAVPAPVAGQEPPPEPAAPAESAPADSAPAQPITATQPLTAAESDAPAVPAGAPGAPDQACRLCHIGTDDVFVFPSGEEMSVNVDPALLDSSVHGIHNVLDVYCTDCHQPRQRYRWPHEPNPAETLHDFQQEISANCQNCHVSLELHNPGHLQVRDDVDRANLPTCTDCHGGHDVAPDEVLYANPTGFCQQCHAIGDMEQPAVRFAHEELLPQLAGGARARAVPAGAEQAGDATGEGAEGEGAAGDGTPPDGAPEAGVSASGVAPADAVHQAAGAADCRTCHSDRPQTQTQQCINCHGLLQTVVERTSATGETQTIDLNVDAGHILGSVHGARVIDGVEYPSLECVDCHRDMAEAGFPHPEELLVDRDQLRVNVEAACVDCHQEVASLFADGIHAHAAAEGELNAASCADCHGSHQIQPPNEPRARISETCGTCHTEVYDQYINSVHGSALYEEDNPDVPVCTDCHNAHDIVDPSTAAFRLSSPEMCGACHADVELMNKYEISTDVFDTYVADFHGTTVTLFQHNSPNEPTNKAVCYDCHGIHDIQRVDEGTAEEIQARLLVTCQQCHPDASENFPQSWMSHYVPSLEHYPLVYLVDLFYTIFIPTILGGFLLFIGTDVFRRVTDAAIRRRRQRRGQAPKPEPASPESTSPEPAAPAPDQPADEGQNPEEHE